MHLSTLRPQALHGVDLRAAGSVRGEPLKAPVRGSRSTWAPAAAVLMVSGAQSRTLMRRQKRGNHATRSQKTCAQQMPYSCNGSSAGKDNSSNENLALASDPALQRVEQRESNARTYVRKFPIVVREAEGCYLTDTDGKRYLDFLSCAGTLALGHNHPVQKEAMLKHLESNAPLQLLDFATTAKDEFIQELFQILPEGMQSDFRVQFCGGSGSDAVEAAVKLCKVATGRSGVMCFQGSYHGMGHGPLAMMGNLDTKGLCQGLMPGVQFLPYPNNNHQPFNLPTGQGGQGEQAVMSYIENVLEDEESGVLKPACMILEVIQGEGGLNAISPWALTELRRITREKDIPLIVDEIQCGLCRSGRMFAFEQAGIEPDVIAISKAAGGSQPLACVVYRNSLDRWPPGAHAGTFRGNGLAFAAGAATLRYMRETELWREVARKGELLQDLILAAGSPYISCVRGRGLMLGIELADPAAPLARDGWRPPCGALAARAQQECLARGLVIERGGRRGGVLRPLPPLVASDEELRQGAGIIVESVAAAAAAVLQ